MKLKEHLRPARAALLIGLAVFVLGGSLWRAGAFSGIELGLYDFFVQARPKSAAKEQRVVVIELKEGDIKALDYPLRDKVLADLLERIESGAPAMIGNDFYRDLPVPRDKSELPALNKTLITYPNIISIFEYASPGRPFAIPPPPIHLSGADADPSRYAFNNLISEGGEIRRALLFYYDADKSQPPYLSFPLALAVGWLQAHNAHIDQPADDLILGRTSIPHFHANDGGYVNEASGGYQFLLDFRGPREFHLLTVQEALALRDTSMFKGKVVLIGNGAESNNDRFSTPVHRVPIPGVEIHAGIVEQLLRIGMEGDAPTSSTSLTVRWLWLALWCAAGLPVGMLVRSYLLFALAVVAGVGLIVLGGWLFFLGGKWILVFWPAVEFLAAAVLVKAYAFSHEGEQRADLMKLFSQSLSPEVAEHIWAHRETFLQGGQPAAQRLTVTVLFSDLKGYSTISESMTPAALIDWVNECYGALAKHVSRNGGFISCYMGDGMMAVFGAPVPRTRDVEFQRDAINAVACAVGMSREIHAMNTRWRAEGKPLAGLRVGIYTGEAMAGMLGSTQQSYSLIGDTVNTASRLESVDKEGVLTRANEECRILIGPQTYNYIKDTYTAKHVGTVTLKGKAATTEVYNVLASVTESENNPKSS